MVKFGKLGKLSSKFIRLFKVLKMVGKVAYRLVLPPNLSGIHAVFHVSMLQKYTPDPTYVVDWASLLSMRMEPLRRDRYISWVVGNRFFKARP